MPDFGGFQISIWPSGATAPWLELGGQLENETNPATVVFSDDGQQLSWSAGNGSIRVANLGLLLGSIREFEAFALTE
jgi:hypothetical protein